MSIATSTLTLDGAQPSPMTAAQQRKIVFAAVIGNLLEFFDFTVYSYFALTIGKQFFPAHDPVTSSLLAFAVFAVGFVMRPLGGFVLGRYADRAGRKPALTLTIGLMALGSAAIGLAPTYAQIGLAAPLLIVAARLLQGFAQGGEFGAATATLLEMGGAKRRGFRASWQLASQGAAALLGSGLAASLGFLLSDDIMHSWGWRIPFIVAAPLGLAGLFLRWRMAETPAFKAMAAEENLHTHSPLRETLQSQGSTILRLGAFISLTALSFYTFTTYFATYLQVVGNLTRSQSLLVSTIALFFAACACPVAGRISDFIGRRKSIGLICAWVIIVVLPAFWLASSGSLTHAVFGVILLAIGALASNVVTATLMSESFPTRTRYTASAFTYNISYTIFGGTAPLMATWLIDQTGSNLSPAFYLVLIAILAMVGGLGLRETSRISLQGNMEAETPSSTRGNTSSQPTLLS